MGDESVKDDQSFEQVICAIQEHLNRAESEIARLGEELQFLIGDSDVEIVRRGPTGETARPKAVIAELKGCDPMLWQPEHPAWMRSALERGWRRSSDARGSNGQPPSSNGDGGSGGSGDGSGHGNSDPPAGTGGQS